jgi:ArsR family transcriptional regulator
VKAGPASITAGEVARAMNPPANTMSPQLAILTRASLVQSRRDGR